MGLAVGISLLWCIKADIYVKSFILLVMAAIYDLRHTQISDSILVCLSVLPDPENMGIAVGIALLSCIRPEIYVIHYQLPVNGCHL